VTEATFYCGTRQEDARYWFTWNPSMEYQFTIPEAYHRGATLYLLGVSSGKRNTVIDVLWGDKIVQHMDFDSSKDHEMRKL